jgi:hypothetical protein
MEHRHGDADSTPLPFTVAACCTGRSSGLGSTVSTPFPDCSSGYGGLLTFTAAGPRGHSYPTSLFLYTQYIVLCTY